MYSLFVLYSNWYFDIFNICTRRTNVFDCAPSCSGYISFSFVATILLSLTLVHMPVNVDTICIDEFFCCCCFVFRSLLLFLFQRKQWCYKHFSFLANRRFLLCNMVLLVPSISNGNPFFVLFIFCLLSLNYISVVNNNHTISLSPSVSVCIYSVLVNFAVL